MMLAKIWISFSRRGTHFLVNQVLAFWSVVVLKGSQFSLQMLELHDLLGYGVAFTTFGPRKTDGTMKALSPKQYLYIIYKFKPLNPPR